MLCEPETKRTVYLKIANSEKENKNKEEENFSQV